MEKEKGGAYILWNTTFNDGKRDKIYKWRETENKQTFRLMKSPRHREINIACSILFEGPSFKYFVLHVYLRYMWKSEN